MSYCDTCVHCDVCGVEGANDEAIVYCADRMEPCDVFDEYGNYKYPSDVELPEPNTATSMPCKEAVSRQVVKELMIKYGFHAPDMTVTEFVEDLPSVKPQEPKWIPVSEGLPKRNGQYLVTKATGNYNFIDCIEYSTNLAKTDKFDFHGKNYAGWYEYDMEYGYFETHGVIAWMPLPEPFAAESEEKK